MRWIYACVLVVGIVGLFGFGMMRSIAQTEPPVLQPDQLKPTTYANPKSPSTASAVEPGIQIPSLDGIDPIIPPAPEGLPVLVPPKPIPVLSPSAPKNVKVAPAAAAPEIMLPVIDVRPAPLKFAAPVVESKIAPDVPFTSLHPPAIDPVRTSAPAGNRVTPSVSIEAIAPDMVPFGQLIVYEIVVKNTGSVPVTHVRVDEELGSGVKFVSSEPAGETNGEKALWMLGSLNVGEEKRIKIRVKPGEGDLNTKPRVSWSAAAALNVRVARPNLVLSARAPEAVLVGDEVPLQIQIANNGTGDASRILLKAVFSDGLKHPEGNDIQALVNKLAPGESQTVTLRIQAGAHGVQNCTFTASVEGAGKASTHLKVDVREPKLNLAVSAPVRCMVRAEPTFTLEVANNGTSATEPVQLAAAFPEGLDFGSASDGGAYDPATRTVTWNLGPAGAGSKRNLTVKAKSSIAGNLAVRAVAQAGPKLNARAEAIIQAEGVPSLMFEVVDLEDPIEVGKETTYEIRIANTGTMHCTNVKLTAAMSDGLSVGSVSSNVPHQMVGQTLVFEPIAKLPVKGDLIVRVKAKGTMPGDQRFKVQLSCDQLKQPVVKEESTSFFQP